MTRSDQEIRSILFDRVMEQVSSSHERRAEALREFFSVSMPALSETEAERIAEMVPPLLPELYAKWITMFLDRLLETVPREQLEELCEDTRKNQATIGLVFIMFMESARMEEQIPKDLHEYGLRQTGAGDMGDAVAGFIRSKMSRMGELLKKREQ
ncbi:MAG: hypothetical protein ACLFQR_13235 [Desulfovibrionales bacterium]